MGQETWIEKAEQFSLFSNSGKGAEAARLLEISNTNRLIVDEDQAVILQLCRFIGGRLDSLYNDKRYDWWNESLVRVEEHQATMDGYTREQYIKVAIEQGRAANAMKNKSDMEILQNK